MSGGMEVPICMHAPGSGRTGGRNSPKRETKEGPNPHLFPLILQQLVRCRPVNAGFSFVSFGRMAKRNKLRFSQRTLSVVRRPISEPIYWNLLAHDQ